MELWKKVPVSAMLRARIERAIRHMGDIRRDRRDLGAVGERRTFWWLLYLATEKSEE